MPSYQLLPFLLLVGCGENQITVVKRAPEVFIDTPDGTALLGQPFNLSGGVTDDTDTFVKMDVTWTWTAMGAGGASDTETCMEETDLGRVGWTWTPTFEGPHSIMLRAMDTDGLATDAKVQLDVGTDAQPTATIFRPYEGLELHETGVEVLGVVWDDTTPESQLSVSWTSDGIDLGIGVTPTDSGETDGIVGIPAGSHLLRLSVTDAVGQTGEDEMMIDVLPCFLDEDGDGHYTDVCPGGDDCDDTAGTAHPGASEVCDGMDDDCDGEVDEGGNPWYLDADGDGFGDPSLLIYSCAGAVDGYVSNDDDCDDANPLIHPGAEEVCTEDVDYNCDGSSGWEDRDQDGWPACEDCDDLEDLVSPLATEICNDQDDDCDGTADEDDATDAATWYLDADGDAHGDILRSSVSCSAPSGYVADATDCDDSDPAFHPGAVETCADQEDFNCDGSTGFLDGDGDGFAACEDCDDTSSAAHPGGSEMCDGLDNDCDGSVDEDDAADVTAWYRDADGDGFGNAAISGFSCSPSIGYVNDATDCDDTNDFVNPGAFEACNDEDDDCDGLTDEEWGDVDGDGILDCADPEMCDGLDNDGDGAVDEGFGDADGDGTADCMDSEACDGADNDGDGEVDEASATNARTWFPDLDGDGYGGGTGLRSCTAPAGYVTDASDCVDVNAAIHPGAEELCDGIDNDCDGSNSDAGVDADGDGYYFCGGAGEEEDCDDGDSTVHPDAEELCDGEDNNCNGEYPIGEGVDADRDGALACECGDFDDPAACAMVADCDDVDGTVYPGAVEICDDQDNDCDGSMGAEETTDDDGDGHTLCDDCDDADPTSHPGATEVWDGRDNDCDEVVDDQIDHDLADFCVEGEELGDGAYGTFFGGRSDLDGDGLADLVVAAPGYDPSSSTTGAGLIGIFFGSANGFAGGATEATLVDADVVILGDTYSENIWPMSIGDLDGDGADDLMVADNGYYPAAGESFFFFTGVDHADSLSMGDAIDSVRPSSWIGWDRGHFGGDWDGDGLSDIVSPEVVFGEAAYVIDGARLGSLNGAYAAAVADMSIRIEGAYYYGAPVNLEEDLGGSGRDDLTVACIACDEGGGSASGAVYVFFSRGAWTGSMDQDDADAVLYAATAGDRLGYDVSSPGDIDGDGEADLLVQSGFANEWDGVLYVVPGPIPTGVHEISSVALSIETEVTSNYAFGYAPTAADLDGDGLLEILTVRTTYDSTAFLFGGDDLALTEGTSLVAEGAAIATFDVDTMPDSIGTAIGPDADGDGTAEIVLYGYGEEGGGYSTSENEACVFYGRNGP